MDRINPQSLWLGTHGSINVECRNHRVNAGKSCVDQKCVSAFEPVSFIALDDSDEDKDDLSHGFTSSLHGQNESSWENLPLEDAVALLDDPHQLPSFENLIVVLKKCRRQGNVKYAMRIYMHVLGHGLESHALMGNYLIPMLVKCNRMSDAQSVFNRSGGWNEHVWTALIFGCVDEGNPEKAVNLSNEMLEHGVTPSRHTYVALLKACARLKKLRWGRVIHSKIIEENYENDLFIGNMLVDMYAKCGSVSEAQKVFDMMPLRDVISWTALLAGYADHGMDHKALECLDQMRMENVLLNNVTFVCGLKACANIGHLEKGQHLHEEIVETGLEKDLIIGNALVDMYFKCGHIDDARSVFNSMPTHDQVSWNTLIAGYADRGLGDEAFDCWKQMRKEGKSPTMITFVCLLKACSRLAALDRGRKIHAEIDKEGFEKHLLVGNALLDMYCRCGSVTEAETCFHAMPIRDVVSWTTLMAGYVEHSLPSKALDCFREMQGKGLEPDVVMYLLIIKACSSLRSLDIGREMHTKIDRAGYGRHLAIGNSLVDMYIKCGSLEEAQDVFRKLPCQNVVSWTAFIAGYAERGQGEDAMKAFEQMKGEGMCPNELTYASILKACGSIRNVVEGLHVHGDIIVDGYEQDLVVGNSLIDMYAKFGSLREAQEVFDELSTRDAISWTALIAGYANCRLLDKASKLFIQMQLEGIAPESIAFNPLIMGHSKKGHARKPLILFHQMGEKGVLPDRVTLLSILKACANGTSLEIGKRIHALVHVLGANDNALATYLIEMYSRLGSIVDSQKVFDALERQDCSAWAGLMKGYARLKDSSKVLDLFERMMQEGIEPDGTAFLIVLNACRGAKLVDKGQLYFDMMTKEYGIVPTAEHRDSMVDLLEKAGRIDEAIAILL